MNLHIEENFNRLVVIPHGSLDVMTAPAFLAEVGQIVARGAQTLIFDMSQVTFIDTAGSSALVSLLRKVRLAGGVIALTRLTHAVDMKLRLRNLDTIFDIYPDTESALRRH